MQRRLSNDIHSKALELRYGQIPYRRADDFAAAKTL
jgi:hypothetical protein